VIFPKVHEEHSRIFELRGICGKSISAQIPLKPLSYRFGM
jgi:hypothetical protein